MLGKNKNTTLKKIGHLNNRVKCKICGKYYSMITWSHLRNHNTTTEAYKKKFKIDLVKSDELRYRSSQIRIESQRYPSWGPNKIIEKIQEVYEKERNLNPYSAKKHYIKLYDAALYYFDSWKKAIEEAGYNFTEVTDIKYDKKLVSRDIKKLYKAGKLEIAADMTDKGHGTLYNASVNHFGSFSEAVEEAGIDYEEFRKKSSILIFTGAKKR